VIKTPAPEGEEEDADEDERSAEANPEAERAQMAAEAEPSTEGESHEPIGAEVADHGRAGVASPAEGAGGDGLDAVEELEGSARGEQNDGRANEDGIVGVDARDVLREDEKHNTHAKHKWSAKEDGGVAGIFGAGKIAASDGLPNPHGRGGRDAQRNHVGEGDSVERNLVARERNGPEAWNERSDSGKDA